MISKLAVTAALTLAVGTALAGTGSASAAEVRPAGVVHLGGVSMQNACNNQYPGQGRRSIAMDPLDAGSWRCKRVVTEPRPGAPVYVYYGGINVTAECRVEYGGSNVYSAAADPHNAGSWYCYRAS